METDAEHNCSIVRECFEQAVKGLIRSVSEGNQGRIQYWLPRVRHLMNELILLELETRKAA